LRFDLSGQLFLTYFQATVESSGDEADPELPSKPVVMVSKKEDQSPKKSPLNKKPLSKPKVSHTFPLL